MMNHGRKKRTKEAPIYYKASYYSHKNIYLLQDNASRGKTIQVIKQHQ